MKSRYHWEKYTNEDFKKGIAFANEAIAKDPNYALAYAGLADSYYWCSSMVMSAAEAMPKARAAAKRALELDETLAEAHAALANVIAFYDWDWAAAERKFQRAIELNPNYASAHHFYGQYLD